MRVIKYLNLENSFFIGLLEEKCNTHIYHVWFKNNNDGIKNNDTYHKRGKKMQKKPFIQTRLIYI